MNANKLNTCRPDNVGGFDDFGESDEFGEISSNCQMNAMLADLTMQKNDTSIPRTSNMGDNIIHTHQTQPKNQSMYTSFFKRG